MGIISNIFLFTPFQAVSISSFHSFGLGTVIYLLILFHTGLTLFLSVAFLLSQWLFVFLFSYTYFLVTKKKNYFHIQNHSSLVYPLIIFPIFHHKWSDQPRFRFKFVPLLYVSTNRLMLMHLKQITFLVKIHKSLFSLFLFKTLSSTCISFPLICACHITE